MKTRLKYEGRRAPNLPGLFSYPMDIYSSMWTISYAFQLTELKDLIQLTSAHGLAKMQEMCALYIQRGPRDQEFGLLSSSLPN